MLNRRKERKEICRGSFSQAPRSRYVVESPKGNKASERSIVLERTRKQRSDEEAKEREKESESQGSLALYAHRNTMMPGVEHSLGASIHHHPSNTTLAPHAKNTRQIYALHSVVPLSPASRSSLCGISCRERRYQDGVRAHSLGCVRAASREMRGGRGKGEKRNGLARARC